MLWQERFERLIVARAALLEDPGVFFEAQMRGFDEALEFDPENSAEAVADRRMAELMEEVA